ncbi:WGR domain-containing protein [Donghicola mangrovi]|uniref:WGR domain-containing protein n=1 Tax=Donghicola mangrovi TaxID=2729614 RepID=A0A850Q661_9RHOB|nr:WGR domain-containing protein [Donghicola mangrovi]NVO24443.1 WGR domain-containing protein [Donghicola mangrovi]
MSHPLSPSLRLTRCDPQRNMARFYEAMLQPTLFGEVALVRNWGRIGSAGQLRTETFGTPEQAQNALDDLNRRKCKRGYRPFVQSSL